LAVLLTKAAIKQAEWCLLSLLTALFSKERTHVLEQWKIPNQNIPQLCWILVSIKLTLFSSSWFHLLFATYKGWSESNTSGKVSHALRPRNEPYSYLLTALWVSVCSGIQHSKKPSLESIWFRTNDSFPKVPKNTKLLSFWYMKVKIPIKIRQQLLAHYGEYTVNISPVCWRVKNQERVGKFGLERQAVVWKACHHNTRF